MDFPINSMVIFHGKMLVHQRVMDLQLTNQVITTLMAMNISYNWLYISGMKYIL